jgi:hypothetical protein
LEFSQYQGNQSNKEVKTENKKVIIKSIKVGNFHNIQQKSANSRG